MVLVKGNDSSLEAADNAAFFSLLGRLLQVDLGKMNPNISLSYLALILIVKNTFEMQASEGKIASILLSQRANIFNMNRDALTRRFGKEIELNIWDLVSIYNGIDKEYLFLIIFDNRPLNIRDVSVFIVDLLEEVVVGVLNKKPKAILQNTMMDNYVESACKGNSVSVVEQRRKLFELLFSTLKELAITNYHKTELHEALVILQEELERDQPRSVLILAMLQFLKKEHELKSIIEQLRKVWGGPAEPMEVNVFPLILQRRSFAGSMIGGIRETQEMLDFCAEHHIAPEIEVIAVKQIDEAWERVLASDVRYRFVIDINTMENE